MFLALGTGTYRCSGKRERKKIIFLLVATQNETSSEVRLSTSAGKTLNQIEAQRVVNNPSAKNSLIALFLNWPKDRYAYTVGRSKLSVTNQNFKIKILEPITKALLQLTHLCY